MRNHRYKFYIRYRTIFSIDQQDLYKRVTILEMNITYNLAPSYMTRYMARHYSHSSSKCSIEPSGVVNSDKKVIRKLFSLLNNRKDQTSEKIK